MPIFRIVYRPVFDIKQLDPRTHLVRETVILEAGATLIIHDGATLWIAEGDPESYMKITENSTTEYN